MSKPVPVQDFSNYLWAAIVIMLTSTLILMSLVVSYDIYVRLGLSSIPVALLLVGVTILWGPMILLTASLFVDVFAPFCFLPFGWGTPKVIVTSNGSIQQA